MHFLLNMNKEVFKQELSDFLSLFFVNVKKLWTSTLKNAKIELK
jgi:hypothetical protein